MSFIDAIILGLVQGLTEFIPISSSGHLILARDIFGIQGADELAVDAVLQLATSIAILAYFAKRLKELVSDKVLVQAVIIGTIPAVIIGFLLENYMNTVFRSSMLVAWTLLAGAALMALAEYLPRKEGKLNLKKGLAIGFFQSLALVPGISRSGATISGGLLAGLSRSDAATFSFLLALPILLGSGLKKLFDLYQDDAMASLGAPLILGSIVAFVSGLLAIHFLITYLKNHRLTPFIWYRVALALVIFAFI